MLALIACASGHVPTSRGRAASSGVWLDSRCRSYILCLRLALDVCQAWRLLELLDLGEHVQHQSCNRRSEILSMILPQYRVMCRECSGRPSCSGGPWIQQHEREDLGMLWSLPSQPSLAIPKLPEKIAVVCDEGRRTSYQRWPQVPWKWEKR